MVWAFDRFKEFGISKLIDQHAIRYHIAYFATAVGPRKPQHLFIHIPKNGGMSIRKAPQLEGQILPATRKRLKSKAYSNAVLETMKASGDHPDYEHARYRDVRPSIRKANNAFAIVRNPWSRVVSRRTFSLHAMNDGRSPGEYSAWDFEDFLEERHKWGDKDFFWHRAIRYWYPQLDYVVDESGEKSVNLFRLEDLCTEFAEYFKIAGDPKPRNVTSRSKKHCRLYYTPKTIQIVADWYAKDIQTFGFDFDTSASRTVSLSPEPFV